MSFCDYGDEYIIVSWIITITEAGQNDAAKQLNEWKKRVIFKNYAPFTNWISEINNILIDNGKYIDVVLAMYI